jgi:hypothetical protein
MVQIRLLSMTVILTALIWASADRLVNENGSIGVTFSIAPEAGDSDMLVSVDPGQDRFEIEISGPRNLVESVQARGQLNITLPVADRATGAAAIPLDRALVQRQVMERWSEFAKLRVVTVTPSVLNVVVDHMVTRPVELLTQEVSLAYDVAPQLQKVTTVLRVRESRAPPADQPLQIEVGPSVERLLNERPFGQTATVTVALDSRSYGPDAEFQPSTVRATATVRAQRSIERIPTVPVLVALSFANLDRAFRAVDRDGVPLALVTRTIAVTGSTDAVRRLVRGETRAYGMIQLKEDDLEDFGVLKLITPDYHLPPGVELAEAAEPIEMKLVASDRSAP